MPVLNWLLGIMGVIAIFGFIPVSVAAYWVHVFRLPAGERGWALYRAISGTVGLIAFPFMVGFFIPGGLGQAARAFYALGFHMPLAFRLLFIAIFLGGLFELYRESRLIAGARAKQAARAAKIARGYDWPQGSDNPQ